MDVAGNAYVAGYVYGPDTYGFGNTISVTGVLAAKANALVLKYDVSGAAQWAAGALAADLRLPISGNRLILRLQLVDVSGLCLTHQHQ